jgi:hypothetical protein
MDEDDNPELVAALERAEVEVSNKIDSMFMNSSYSRIKCFNHSLHNVVGDGIKVAGRRFEVAVGKVQRLAVLQKKSAAFSDALEDNFGGEVSFNMGVKTRWNSQFRMLEHYLGLDSEKLQCSIEQHGKSSSAATPLSAIDTETIKEAVSILDCFQEATLLTEGDKLPTLNKALPLSLSIIKVLQSQVGKTNHCGNMIAGLLLSLYSRFNCLLQMVNFSARAGPPFQPNTSKGTWGDDIFLVAPLLDSSIKLLWVDSLCDFLSTEEKVALKLKVQTIASQMMVNIQTEPQL